MKAEAVPMTSQRLTEAVSPKLSILVRCKNEMQALPEFWRRLHLQTAWPLVEVLILDSGSTDGSLDFLSRQRCRIYSISSEDFNFGRSCNQLMRFARAPRAMFLSAHVLLQNEATLAEIICFLDPQEKQALYLRQEPNPVFGFSFYEAAYLLRRFPPGRTTQQMQQPGAFSNAASALTQHAWAEHPFPEMHGSEDHQWAADHLAQGGLLYYMPQLAVLHSHNETPGQVYARVRLNALARGQTKAYGKALLLLSGVFVQVLRRGAPFKEAWTYAVSHARGYL